MLYFLILVISYIYMTTAPINLRTPLFLIPAAMCVSAFEEPFDSAVLGCVAGLLLDTAQGTMVGLSGIIMLWCCLMSSLLFHFFLRRHVLGVMMINLAAILIQEIIYYFFYYAIWEYDPSGKIFTGKFLPVMIYTGVVGILIYRLGVVFENLLSFKRKEE